MSARRTASWAAGPRCHPGRQGQQRPPRLPWPSRSREGRPPVLLDGLSPAPKGEHGGVTASTDCAGELAWPRHPLASAQPGRAIVLPPSRPSPALFSPLVWGGGLRNIPHTPERPFSPESLTVLSPVARQLSPESPLARSEKREATARPDLPGSDKVTQGGQTGNRHSTTSPRRRRAPHPLVSPYVPAEMRS